MARWPDPATMYEPALHELIGFGARLNRLTPYVRQWIGELAESRRWDALVAAVPRVREVVVTADRAAVLGSIALDLLTADDEDALGAGFSLLCEAATEACTTGELDTAADLADALRSFSSAAAGGEHRRAATQVLVAVDAALERSDALVDWRRRQSETQSTRLAPLCRNKVLHLVGGLTDPWEAELKANLDLAKVERHEAEKDKSPNADWAQSLDPDVDIVVVLWQRIGHSLSGMVKDACRRHDVTLIEARTGERGLLDALEGCLC